MTEYSFYKCIRYRNAKTRQSMCSKYRVVYGAPFVKILYLTDLAQKLPSLAEIAISACRDVICGRDSYLCMQRYYLWQR